VQEELKFPIWLYNKEEGGKIIHSLEQFKTLKGKWVESPALFDAEEQEEIKEEKSEVIELKEHKKRGPKPKGDK